MASIPSPLKYLAPGWFATVMGLAGLSLAWHAAVPLLGDGANAAALVIGVLALLIFLALAVASLWRLQRHPQAWRDDLKHPVRHVFVAAGPVALVLLASTAVAAGVQGPWLLLLWWAGALAQLAVTAWIMARWWRGPQAGGLAWAGLTPALCIAIVGHLLLPLAGVPLGQATWSAAQFGIGLLLWPLVLVLLLVRIAQQGLWPERQMPASFILVAPPAVAGLSLLQWGAPVLVAWALWGMALVLLLWVATLLRRITSQAFSIVHWSMAFPLAAFTALTLRLAPGLAGVALLALTSLLVAALTLATWRGLRDGTLLAPDAVPISAAPAAS